MGELLRNAREDLGLELHQVSDILRIRYVHLRAIEEGQLSELPGQTYALGFVRTYAEYLGLDARSLVEQYKEELSGIPRSTQLVFPTPKPEGKIPGGALVLVSLLLVGLAYGGWYAFNEYEDELTSLIVQEAPPASLPDRGDSDAPATSGEPGGAPSSVEPRREAAPETAAELPSETSGSSAGSASSVTGQETAPGSGQQAENPVVTDRGDGPLAEQPQETEQALGAGTSQSELPGQEPQVEAPAGIPPADGQPAGSPESEAVSPASETAAADPAVPDTADGQSDPALPAQSTTESAPSDLAGRSPEPEAQSAAEVAAPVESLTVLSPSTIGAPAASQQRSPISAAEDAQSLADVTPQPTAEPAPQAASEPAPQTTVAREESIPVPPIPQGTDAEQARSARVFGTANTDARIVLRATADSWVQVRNARSDLLFTQVLRAGDSYNVPNMQGLTLLTGNAGGLEVLVDGQLAPSLGESGAVRRDIELEPENLLRGAP